MRTESRMRSESREPLGPRALRRGGALLLVAAATLAASACSAASLQTDAAAERIAWDSCGPNLECADVAVPLDWSDPEGEQITLAVIKHPAPDAEHRIGTLFINPGGPGDTGVGLVKGAGEDLAAWGDGRFDIVSWDPRGTHGSSPVRCFETDAELARFWEGVRIPSNDAEATAYLERMKDLGTHCHQAMGDLLDHISTASTVRDLDHLRSLVGDEKITYVGLSYGTMIGQTYANMFPDRVRAMLLDGIVDVVASTTDAESRVASTAAPTDEVFDRFLALCDEAGPDRCALTGHGESAATRVARLFEAARSAPIVTPDGELTYSDLLISSFAPLRAPSTWGQYAESLNAAVEGDITALVEGAAPWRLPSAWAEVTKSNAISCLDGPASHPIEEWPSVIDELSRGSTMSGAVQGWWLWAPCAAGWPGTTDDAYRGPWDAITDTPILLINSRYDPNTGYANAVAAEKLLGNAVLLTLNGYGHVSFTDPSACIDAARTAYLVDLEVPAPGTVCEPDGTPFDTQ